jgi:Insertion element 4 transposase N-terminal/Transposase DDE domain
MSGDEAEEQPRTGRLSDYLSLGVMSRVYRRDLVDEVIAETRSKEKRNRLLPARLVVYYLIALALFFGEAYEEVMRKMVGGLRFVCAWERHWHVPTPSALCQARQRLGEAPLRRLFERTAAPVATPATIGAWLHSWRLMAIDGVTLDVPDTPDNEAAFGRPSSRTGHGGAFPQVRVVGLGECGTHAVIAAELGPISTGERELADTVLGDLQAGMLVIFDRGFFSYDFFAQAKETGAELLFRVTAKLTLPMLERLPDSSFLSAVTPNRVSAPATLGEARWRAAAGQAVIVRVVEYQITDRDTPGEVYRLITTITDWEQALAPDLAAAYHQRWEFEIALDEIETHQIAHSRVLRSKSPAMVRQEIWGILLAHYAIRALMTEAAHDADIDPDRLSFIRSLRVIRREADASADFPPSPQK